MVSLSTGDTKSVKTKNLRLIIDSVDMDGQNTSGFSAMIRNRFEQNTRSVEVQRAVALEVEKQRRRLRERQAVARDDPEEEAMVARAAQRYRAAHEIFVAAGPFLGKNITRDTWSSSNAKVVGAVGGGGPGSEYEEWQEKITEVLEMCDSILEKKVPGVKDKKKKDKKNTALGARISEKLQKVDREDHVDPDFDYEEEIDVEVLQRRSPNIVTLVEQLQAQCRHSLLTADEDLTEQEVEDDDDAEDLVVQQQHEVEEEEQQQEAADPDDHLEFHDAISPAKSSSLAEEVPGRDRFSPEDFTDAQQELWEKILEEQSKIVGEQSPSSQTASSPSEGSTRTSFKFYLIDKTKTTTTAAASAVVADESSDSVKPEESTYTTTKKPASKSTTAPRAVSPRVETAGTGKILCPDCNETWTGGKSELKRHRAKVCSMRLVRCPNLGCSAKKKQVPFCELKNHLEFECAGRNVSCEMCQLPVRASELSVHQRDHCEERAVKCNQASMGCNWTGPYRFQAAHETICPYVSYDCVWCFQRMPQHEMAHHECRAVNGDKEECGLCSRTFADLLSDNVVPAILVRDSFRSCKCKQTHICTACAQTWVDQSRSNSNSTTPDPDSTEDGEILAKCPYCQMGYNGVSGLARHLVLTCAHSHINKDRKGNTINKMNQLQVAASAVASPSSSEKFAPATRGRRNDQHENKLKQKEDLDLLLQEQAQQAQEQQKKLLQQAQQAEERAAQQQERERLRRMQEVPLPEQARPNTVHWVSPLEIRFAHDSVHPEFKDCDDYRTGVHLRNQGILDSLQEVLESDRRGELPRTLDCLEVCWDPRGVDGGGGCSAAFGSSSSIVQGRDMMFVAGTGNRRLAMWRLLAIYRPERWRRIKVKFIDARRAWQRSESFRKKWSTPCNGRWVEIRHVLSSNSAKLCYLPAVVGMSKRGDEDFDFENEKDVMEKDPGVRWPDAVRLMLKDSSHSY
ncbi:unnamed protein product [Amoebophrya sp. A25]|nr:unnamed protein product [Amoebophrya sp. A25]|eukprot:GSA25T00008963001.1